MPHPASPSLCCAHPVCHSLLSECKERGGGREEGGGRGTPARAVVGSVQGC